MSHQLVMWIVFNLVVAVMLYIDLGWANRKAHVIGFREAAIWSVVWVAVSLLFCVGIYFYMSPQKALEFLTGYLIEKSLSVDNMFVFIMVFSYFNVGPLDQPRVLKWGILGALVMRLALILVGAALIQRFHWIIYVFGAFLIYTAYKMAFQEDKPFDPETNPIFRLVKRIMPITGMHGHHFFVKIKGVTHATSLFLALTVVEITDLVFALDSIPAIFAITMDPFLVYTSNVFAILGLRALYFLLHGLVQVFVYLKYGVALILAFVGVKMLASGVYHVSTLVSLGIIALVLALSVVASLVFKPKVPAPLAKEAEKLKKLEEAGS
jgi:tellurite resistance protein TerC